MSTTTTPLIKGFLPVRIRLPSVIPEIKDETYVYVKQHQQSKKATTQSNNNNRTLFVANAPVVPGITTQLLLKSLLGRYGDIERVTVIQNPRANQQQGPPDAAATMAWTSLALPTYLAPIHSQGSFAHVVFSTSKELKQTLKTLTSIMTSDNDDDDDDDDDEYPALTLDPVEIQTLADETERQYRLQHGMTDDNDTDDGMLEMPSKEKQKRSGVQRVAERYRASLARLSRDTLLCECNAVMQEYEDAEEQDRLSRQAAANEPDEDGFVTVRNTAQVGSKRELEKDDTQLQRRRKGQKRSRKKKSGMGASELDDFYRFQTKENRKKSLQELRQRFEEDLAKVQKMKEANQYQPF